jgi:hypothetical protein
MPCPVCGEICRCSCDSKSPQHDTATASGASAENSCDLRESQKPESQKNDSDGTAWRQEIAARLNRYHSRRKPRPPRYPSLRLQFERSVEPNPKDAAFPDAGRTSSERPRVTAHPSVPQTSHDALALDGFAEPKGETPRQVDASPVVPSNSAGLPSSSTASPTGKIIEFPRSWFPPVRPADELAEPVITSPRILEVPEFVPPPPALGGITIEPAKAVEVERRPGIDFPLQSASLGRRIFAAGMDAILVSAAGLAFAFIFWKMTGLRPARLQLIEMTSGLGAAFWAAYQYLLIVYSGTTPGLRLARLELSGFDGKAANRRLRRWRVLASFLSALSLGMGYTWVLLDEDALCWHDRITHTYLAPKLAAEKPDLADRPAV